MHNGDDDDGESQNSKTHNWDLTTACALTGVKASVCVCSFGGRFWIRFLIQKGAVLAGRALVGAHASAPVLDVFKLCCC